MRANFQICRFGMPKHGMKTGDKLNFFHFIFFFLKTIVLIKIVSKIRKWNIKKSCACCDVCDNSLGIPSNKKPERTENDSPSTSD
jgi:hypothetical protein